jgi:hypothetical protein
MRDHLATARSYRGRADKLRSIAATLDDEELRAVLSKLAEEYERMASERGRGLTSPSGET